jgi:unsaturated rhamnogalacturonyl hydrolase
MKKNYLLAGALGLLSVAGMAQTKTVTLDYYFNHEFKKDKAGQFTAERFHYLWEDRDQSGYSKWGEVFKKDSFNLKSLQTAPTTESLKGTSVYLIVDPDNDKETPTPNYILPGHIKAIKEWVKQGGVLVVMMNDSSNCEFAHAKELTAAFGITLNEDIKSHVYNDKYEMAAFYIPDNDPIFKTAKKVYLKEVTSLTLSKKARPILVHQTEKYTVAAAAKFGKGTVVVVGDPWFYNEYLNGRLGTNKGWDNDKAADDFTKWLYSISK